MYRSPWQFQDDSEHFSEKNEINLESFVQKYRFLVVLITDFKTKLKKKKKIWYKNDKSSFERNIIKNVIWHFGLQIIKEPTHILNNSSCTDLIFTSQADLLMESGMDPSMHSNCHHQIIYLKFDLHIFFFF